MVAGTAGVVKLNEDWDLVRAGAVPNEKDAVVVAVGAAAVVVAADVPNVKPDDGIVGARGVDNGKPDVLAGVFGCAGVPNENGLAGVDVIPKPVNWAEPVGCAD